MGTLHKPRSGSLAFYPKKRAKKETPSFRTFPDVEGEEAKPLNFYGYKAGMLHAFARNEAEKTTAFGQEMMVPCTVIECPPLTVFGVRALKKTPYGKKTVFDVLAEKFDKHLSRRIKFVGEKAKEAKAKKGREEKPKEVRVKRTLADLEKEVAAFDELKLLVHTSPALTGIGKKKPEVAELALSGDKEKQLAFAKEKLGQKIALTDIFKAKDFIDVRAIDKGKGFAGVVKRAGVKIHRPKAKKHRYVGSISPWNPSTVMWTVARPGQLGYQARTEYNKRILQIGSTPETLNPRGGFTNFGLVKSDYLLLAGSVPGPAKRCIALRQALRKLPEKSFKLGEFTFISTVDRVYKKDLQRGKKAGETEKKKAEEKPAEKKEAKPEIKKEEKKEVKEEKLVEKKVEAKAEAKKEVKEEKLVEKKVEAKAEKKEQAKEEKK